MRNIGRVPADRIEQMLRDGEWVEPMDSVDIAVLSRRAAARRRWLLAGTVGAVAMTISIATAAVTTLGDEGDRSDAPLASSNGAIPWVDQRPAETVDDATQPCAGQGVTAAVGRPGAWHGQTTQQIVLTNSTDLPCMLSAPLLVAVSTASGNTATVDMSAVEGSDVKLSAGQSAQLMIGTPESCGDTGLSIAHSITVMLAGGEAIELSGATLTFGCGDPIAISLVADPLEPATQDIKISAQLSDIPSVVAGQTVDFRVTLTNGSNSPISFAECPSYYMGLKETGTSIQYLLNCSDANAIPEGDSVTYIMKLDIPDDAVGADVLTWSLDGYDATDSAEVRIG